MKTIQNLTLTTSIAGLIAIAPASQAAPVQFDITAASFTVGSGYGVDQSGDTSNGTDAGILLDVVFLNSIFSPTGFQLSTTGAPGFTFDFGTVNFRETRINSNELDALGVTANFTFANPLGSVKNVTATATAFTGPINDSGSDYTLSWDPLDVDFGPAGGQFRLSMNSIAFTNNGTQTQTATITLLTLPTESGNGGASINAIPEPGSIALVGLGLLGLGALRRKQFKS